MQPSQLEISENFTQKRGELDGKVEWNRQITGDRLVVRLSWLVKRCSSTDESRHGSLVASRSASSLSFESCAERIHLFHNCNICTYLFKQAGVIRLRFNSIHCDASPTRGLAKLKRNTTTVFCHKYSILIKYKNIESCFAWTSCHIAIICILTVFLLFNAYVLLQLYRK